MAAARFYRVHRRPPFDDLFSEGVVVMMQLAPRYDDGRGATFATYCAPHVWKRWRSLRDQQAREVAVGGWTEVLGLMRVEGSVMETDAEHQSRVDAAADLFMAAATLTAEQVDEEFDARRFQRFIDELPEPQRSLLSGLYRRGQTLTDLARELGLKRGTARSQVFIGMRALSEHFRGISPEQ